MANHQYKDSLLRHIFNRPETAASIYSAMYGDDTVTADDVKLIMLDNLLMDRLKNDLSFTVRNQYVAMTEYQSTVNANMPLRFSLYVSELFRHLLQNSEAMYRSKIVKIPAPLFATLQSGAPKAPNRKVLRLSDAFLAPKGSMELRVDVFNIDYKPSRPILKKCPPLHDYSLFIHKVNDWVREGFVRDVAIRKGLDYCKTDGILWDYISETYEEVVNMVSLVYNETEARQAWREEALEEGMEKGMEKGLTNGILASIRNLMDSMKWSATEAMNMLKIAPSEQDRYAALLNA